MTAPIPPGYPQPKPKAARASRLAFFGARRRAADKEAAEIAAVATVRAASPPDDTQVRELTAEVARLKAEIEQLRAPAAEIVTTESVVVAKKRTRTVRAKQQAPVAPSLAQMVEALAPYPDDLDLDEQIEVAGETYHIKAICAVYKQVGMPITAKGSTIEQVECSLIPEPWNEHDTNAVGVMIGTHLVGYIPAELAVDYAEPLGRCVGQGCRVTGVARLWAKDDGGMVRARVTVLAPSAELIV